MINEDITLEGNRVRLVPASYDHMDGLFKASNHNEIWTYSPSSISKLDDLISTMNDWMKAKEKGVRYPFVIIDRSTNEIVGSTSYLDISPQNRKLEIGGTWLDPRVWRSNRVIQRIGAQFEGTLRQEMLLQNGYIRDSNVYSILDNEWETVRVKLLDYLKNE